MKKRNLLYTTAACVLLVAGLTGCADEFFADSGTAGFSETEETSTMVPVSPKYSKLRHPQMLEAAKSVRSAGKGAEVADYQLVVSYDIYEADGVTRRVLDKYGVTRRILDKYGVTRRILKKYERCDDGGWQDEDECEFTPLRLRLYDEILGGISVEISDFYLDSLLSFIESDPDLAWVDPDWLLNFPGATIVQDDQPSSQVTPWSVDRIGAQLASYNGDDVHVYLLDSGVYERDLNLQGDKKDFTVLFVNRDQEFIDEAELLAAPVYDPNIQGDPSDGSGHGTHAAGIIGAKDNSEGILGVAPNIKLHNYKVLTDDGKTDVTTVIAAVNHITNIKIANPDRPMVVNMSLGADIGTTFYNVLDEAIERSIDTGVVYVVSAGNDGADASTYSPAHVAGAITVGAYDEFDELADFSNYGSVVDILAPGVDVPSLTHVQEVADAGIDSYMSGTSTAAPHVTAAVAIYLALYPNSSPAEVRNAIVNFGQEGILNVPAGTTNKTVYVAGYGFDPNGQEELKIEKAEWDKDLAQLIVRGNGAQMQPVQLYGAGDATEIANMDADVAGAWNFTIAEGELGGVPCAVLVKQGQDQVVKDVSDRPYNCVTTLNLDGASWDANTRALLLEGQAVSGQTVRFKSALLNTVFASVVANELGEFQAIAYTPEDYLVPCDVTAFIGTITSEKSVANAPDICDYGRNNNEEPFLVTEAGWDAPTGTLTIRGTGLREARVMARSSGYETDISTTTVYYDGNWDASVTSPSVVPCSLVVESAGVSAVTPVAMAPAGCEASPIIKKAEWSSPILTIDADGTAGMTAVISSPNTGAIIATPVFDSNGEIALSLSTLEVVPCRVRLAANGLINEVDVHKAPVGCDDMALVDLKKAKWSSLTGELRLEGEAQDKYGSASVTVTLRNATTGQLIGTADTDDKNAWALFLYNPADVPCSVTAELDGTIKGLAVEGAPSTCDGGRGPILKFGKAEWIPSSATLRMEGKASPFTEVELRKSSDDLLAPTIANAVSDAFGTWRVDATVDFVPCAVRADTDSATQVRPTVNAPKSCN